MIRGRYGLCRISVMEAIARGGVDMALPLDGIAAAADSMDNVARIRWSLNRALEKILTNPR